MRRHLLDTCDVRCVLVKHPALFSIFWAHSKSKNTRKYFGEKRGGFVRSDNRNYPSTDFRYISTRTVSNTQPSEILNKLTTCIKHIFLRSQISLWATFSFLWIWHHSSLKTVLLQTSLHFVSARHGTAERCEQFLYYQTDNRTHYMHTFHPLQPAYCLQHHVFVPDHAAGTDSYYRQKQTFCKQPIGHSFVLRKKALKLFQFLHAAHFLQIISGCVPQVENRFK